MADNSSEDQHDPEQRITSIVLAEFSGLRGEIGTRVNLLASMIIANLTVLGVVFGIALNSGNTKVLLVLPFVTPSLGVMYIDQQRNLIFLGDYIKDRIHQQLQIDDHPEVFGWESYVRERQFSLSISAPYLSAVFVQFLIPPIAVLIYAQILHSQVLTNTLQRWLWWAGAVWTIGWTVYALLYLTSLFPQPRKSSAMPKAEDQAPAQESPEGDAELSDRNPGDTTETE